MARREAFSQWLSSTALNAIEKDIEEAKAKVCILQYLFLAHLDIVKINLGYRSCSKYISVKNIDMSHGQ